MGDDSVVCGNVIVKGTNECFTASTKDTNYRSELTLSSVC